MDNAYQHSTIAQIIENILEQYTFEGESKSNIADILLSILNKTEYNEEPHSVIGDLLIRLKAKIEGESFDPYDAAYTSRIAEILISILEETEYTEEPQSRIAELLLELKEELEAYTELTASGAIASFITNVVKPLVNGEFTIQAYQEGSGDPSPVNVRNIVGYNALNMLHYGGNLFDKSTAVLGKWLDLNTGVEQNASTNYALSDYIPVKKGVYYALKNPNSSRAWLYDQNYNPIERMNSTSLYTPSMDGYIRFTILVNNDMSTLNDFMVVVGNSLPTAYEPYVTPEVKTKQLGEDVYGGSYNSVSGKRIKSYKTDVFNLTDAISKTNLGTYSRYLFALSSTCVQDDTELCNYAPRIVDYSSQTTHFYCGGSNRNRAYLFLNNSITELSNIQIMYLLAEPIETNIGATEIETFDGANNIFCDTGDTSVTYLYKGTPPETLTRVLSKSPDVEDIIKEEKLEDLKDLDELQDPDISDKEVK